MSFFFTDTATTEIYTLSLHDALPIFHQRGHENAVGDEAGGLRSIDGLPGARDFSHLQVDRGRLQRDIHKPVVKDPLHLLQRALDRKSTRLNSSHPSISYAVFCLKKKK